jgi:hypothetical protein
MTVVSVLAICRTLEPARAAFAAALEPLLDVEVEAGQPVV